LSIVAAVAQAHGGDAAAQPTPDGGATFVVTLPLARS
jgi:signal transduction histidine kinase